MTTQATETPQIQAAGKAILEAATGEYIVADLPEAQQHFALLLGLDRPVSEAVLTAAVNDPLYAMHLISSRSSPQFLDILLNNPPGVARDATTSAFPQEETQHSAGELLGRFAKAMVGWSRSGFATAPKELLEKRLDTCRACPNLKARDGGSILQRLASTVGLDGHSCGLCGCFVSAKARILRESCPGEDPAKPGFTRWGDPMPERKQGA